MLDDEKLLINGIWADLVEQTKINAGFIWGQDAAELAIPSGYRLVVSVDQCVMGIHTAETTSVVDWGFKAVSTAVSDLAAHGSIPLSCLIAVAWQASFSDWQQLATGILDGLNTYHMALIGGDMTNGHGCITITVMGLIENNHPVANWQDISAHHSLWVSGNLGWGGAGYAVAHQQIVLPQKLANQALHNWHRPTAQIQMGRQIKQDSHALMIDLSDSLLVCLSKLMDASQLGCCIDMAKVPVDLALQQAVGQKQLHDWILFGGEDYHLLAAVSPNETNPPVGWHHIGMMTETDGIHIENSPVALDRFNRRGGFHRLILS